ncbi:MAG: sterol desaturase family protein [Flavobacteriales bacterium]|nr:sterol desaturase family protein [Flavobacteriales bacterium]
MSKSKMHNMVTTNPGLLKWFTSKNPREVLYKIMPLLAIYLSLMFYQNISSLLMLIFIFIGVLTWSLFEYFTHRYLYHTNFKNKALRWFLESFHLYHHHHLKDYRVLNAGLLLVYPMAILFTTTMFFIVSDLQLTGAFGLGMLLYYYFYENIHYYIHYKTYKKGYMSMIQKYHLYHHYFKWNKNYGNTTRIWDIVFGTYDDGYKKMNFNSEQIDDLITKK